MATESPAIAPPSIRRPPAVRRAARRVSELWDARGLLRNMVVRDIKLRYKNSILGFGWSMLTPLAMMLIFNFIFTRVMDAGIKDFPIFFLAAFLPWQYFANSVQGSVGAIVGNGNLIKKVYFPREVLPLSTVLSQGVHFLFSLIPFFAFLAYRGYNFLPMLPFLVLAMILQTLFNSGMAMLFAATNVRYRDIQELVIVTFLLWFYMTPVIYPIDRIGGSARLLFMLNPMTHFVSLYRQTLYFVSTPSLKLIGVVTLISFVMFGVGYALFSRLAVTFAKEV